MQLTIPTKNSFQLLLRKACRQSFFLLLFIAGFGMESFAQPGNDDPCNAIPLVADVVCNFQTFDNTGATVTVGPPPAPTGVACPATIGDDVWFQVVVPAASNGTLTINTLAMGMDDAVMQVYRGTCTNLQWMACDDDGNPPGPNNLMPILTLNSLTVGSTIWIRVYGWNNNDHGTFGICVKYPGPPPAYDDPCTATALPTPTTACNFQTFTDDGATVSVNVPAATCATPVTGDVWFTVVVPAAGILDFNTQVGEVTDGGMAIYSGDCNNLTQIACDDNSSQNGNMPQIIQNNLTPGSTIWIRFWSNGLTNNTGSFGLCVSIPPPPPANDDVCNAILLTATNNCTYQTFTTASATNTVGPPAPGCAGTGDGDVWFKVIVPCEGSLVFDTQEGDITDGGMAIYRGVCGNLQLINCDDNNSPNGLMPMISQTSLTPGSTIWIRFWENGNNIHGTFKICISIPPPPIPGGGGNCLNAQPFCSSNTYTFNNTVGVLPGLGGGGIYGCLNTTPNPTWFYMQVQTSGPINIHIEQTNPGGYQDVDFVLWGPFPSLAASCGNLSASNIVDCSYSFLPVEDANIPNAAAGDFYVLLLTNFSNAPGTITFSQQSGTGATSCDIICQTTAGNSGPVCAGGTINLTSQTVVGGTYQWTGPNCFSQQIPLSQQQNPTGVVVPNEPGTYIYSVTAITPSGAMCHALDTVIVLASPMLNDTTVYICSGSTKDLYAVYDTTGLTSSWSHYPGGETVANPGAEDTAGIYQLIVTNIAGCIDTALVTLDVSQKPNIGNDTTVHICAGNTQDLTTLYASVTTGFTTDWTIGGVAVANPQAVSVDGVYQLIATSPQGCSDTALVTLITDPKPAIGADSTVYVCSGNTRDLNTIYNTTGLTTAWTTYPGAVIVADPSAVNTAGMYQVIATSPEGCSDTALVTLNVDVVNATVLPTGNATCSIPGLITVSNPTGTGSVFEYNINTYPGVYQAGNTFNATIGDYTILVRDSLGCISAPLAVTITGVDDLVLNVTPADTSICLGASVTLQTNSNATSYAWLPATGLNNASSATPVATPAANTIYTVTATLGSCVKTGTSDITIYNDLSVDAGGPFDVIAGQTQQVNAIVTGSNTTLTSILWTPATGLSSTTILNPVVTPVGASGPTTYDITVTNSNGCIATDKLIVNVTQNLNCENVRTAFTPNGDGTNDQWMVYDSYNCLANVTVAIFNRYGSKIYESTNYRNTWDGKYKGKELPDGTYYAVIEFKFLAGKSKTVRTDVTLLR